MVLREDCSVGGGLGLRRLLTHFHVRMYHFACTTVSPIRRDTTSAPPQESPPRPPSQSDSSQKRRSGSFGSKLGSKFSGLLSRNKEDKKTPDIPKSTKYKFHHSLNYDFISL